jgi:hypothetical protein
VEKAGVLPSKVPPWTSEYSNNGQGSFKGHWVWASQTWESRRREGRTNGDRRANKTQTTSAETSERRQ